jgi:hypothetical protein
MEPNDVPITSPLTIGIACFFGIVGTHRKGVLKIFPIPLAGKKMPPMWLAGSWQGDQSDTEKSRLSKNLGGLP